MKHGGPYAYRKLKCRCEECRRGNADRVARWRARRISAGADRTRVYGNQNGRGWDRWPRNTIIRGLPEV